MPQKTRRWAEEGGSQQVHGKILAINNLAVLADREGFEPSKRLITVYTLSRRAPSTARPPVHFREVRLCREGRKYTQLDPYRKRYPAFPPLPLAGV